MKMNTMIMIKLYKQFGIYANGILIQKTVHKNVHKNDIINIQFLIF